MSERVKPRRSYHSPRRQQQAAATRQTILEAAERLFEQHGYPATTMEQVAAEAGVGLKTVYVAFTSKGGLLRALWDLRLKGDQDQAAVADRPWYREVLEEPDPGRQLRRNAHNACVVKQRIGGVLKAMLVFLVVTWVRWSFVRIRVDQILAISWKLLLPATLVLLMLTALVVVLRSPAGA